jgi:hypothetical protein
MQDVSAFGTTISILATQSFPIGFTVNKFADDKDPLKIEDIEATGYEFLIDGSLFIFDKAAVIKVQVAVIAASEDDINFKTMLMSRKGSSGVLGLPDVTTMTISYGNGGVVVFTNGSIVSGPLGDSIEQSGRHPSNTYTFVFSDFAGAQSVSEVVNTALNAIAGLF